MSEKYHSSKSKSNKENWVSQEYDFKDFNTIDISGADKLYIEQGDAFQIRVEGLKSMLKNVNVSQSGEKLNISRNAAVSFGNKELLNIYVTVPDLKKLKTKGKVDVKSSGILKLADSFEIVSSGSAILDLVLEVPKLVLQSSGDCKVNLNGRVGYLDLKMSGASIIQAYDLHSDSTHIDASGATIAYIWSKSYIEVLTSGAASIYHKGNAVVTAKTTGVSKVTKEL